MRFLSTFTAILFFGLSQAEAAININTADTNTLTKFNGVGASTAQNIIDYRTANGDFASCDDLTKVKGIGATKLENIKPDCTVGEPAK